MDIYKEAEKLLNQTNPMSLLQRFGEVELVGSYRYRTMVERDIDFQVWPKKKIDFALRTRLLEELAGLRDCRSLSMSDLLHFPDFAIKPLPGIWYGLSCVHPQTYKKWNIDIWLIDKKEDPTQQAKSLHQQMLHISENQRRDIVRIKQQQVASGNVIKGVTSVDIYRTVLED